MRITMEPTEDQSSFTAACRNHKVTLEVEGDDIGFDETIDMIRLLLIAWGFHPATVNEVLGEEE